MKSNYQKLHDVLADIPEIYMCPECEDIWVCTGRHCDHDSKAIRIYWDELLPES